jgi:hypothetical protein
MARLRVRNIRVPRYDNARGAKTRCIPITNSEKGLLGCSAKWRFGASENLKSVSTSDKLLFGSCWHKCVEYFHNDARKRPNEDPYSDPYYVEDIVDCSVIDIRNSDPYGYPGTDFDEFRDRLLPLFNAWLERGAWKTATETYEVVGAEIQLAVPVLNPSTGLPFCPATLLAKKKVDCRPFSGAVGYGFAVAGDEVASSVRWPYYQYFTLDALYRCRGTGKLFVFEAKTAHSPKQRIRTALMDPQLSGYVYGTQVAVRAGLIPEVGPDSEVAGYIFDAVCNKPMSQPKENKNGTMSKQSKPTSYALKKYIESQELDRNDFEAEILNAKMNVDVVWFQQILGTCGPEVQQRFAAELFGSAVRIAKMRVDASRCKSELDTHILFPRTPICMGGFCRYKSICLQDDPIGRNNFETAEGVRWLSDNLTEEESKELAW